MEKVIVKLPRQIQRDLEDKVLDLADIPGPKCPSAISRMILQKANRDCVGLMGAKLDMVLNLPYWHLSAEEFAVKFQGLVDDIFGE
jgi:hypothetical protein